jgi:hypothetical protein
MPPLPMGEAGRGPEATAATGGTPRVRPGDCHHPLPVKGRRTAAMMGPAPKNMEPIVGSRGAFQHTPSPMCSACWSRPFFPSFPFALGRHHSPVPRGYSSAE